MTDQQPVLVVEGVTFRYGAAPRRRRGEAEVTSSREFALDDVSFAVKRGEILAFLGPNGGGKTTLFRLLATLAPPQRGRIEILGCDLPTAAADARRRMGVVFQAPSLDAKLTVEENILLQASLYGMSRADKSQRVSQLLQQLGIADRAQQKVEQLSGGLRRRTELAKGMVHGPVLLLMDEPTTGLDPAARSDLWQYLHQLRDEHQVTIVLTTHLLEEADRADRIAVLHRGQLVALDTPSALREELGGDQITITTSGPEQLAEDLERDLGLASRFVNGSLRLPQPPGEQLVGRILDRFSDRIDVINLGKPTLEDVFIAKTGHRFWSEEA